MVDVLTKAQRRKCMSAIRGKDIKPELLLRKTLWQKGLWYRLKNKLPGKPDIVFPSEHVAIFVDGCFWHGCPEHFQQPETNAEFWREKIEKNKERDRKTNVTLESDGWQVLRFWEHEVTNNLDNCINKIINVLKETRAQDG
ncbi:very short patch repair endonuclease [Thiolapillus sp.]|uniref:very short patch repair endonuclease n=1 Tax=Thiolapillus sp. TaxID=2017437 RepID=UPI0025F247F4|nr:very short patch repair endonuclease [Thiolapillus sp.]